MTTLFHRHLMPFLSTLIQHCSAFKLHCRLTQRCFNVVLTLPDAVPSDHLRNNVETTLKCLLATLTCKDGIPQFFKKCDNDARISINNRKQINQSRARAHSSLNVFDKRRDVHFGDKQIQIQMLVLGLREETKEQFGLFLL